MNEPLQMLPRDESEVDSTHKQEAFTAPPRSLPYLVASQGGTATSYRKECLPYHKKGTLSPGADKYPLSHSTTHSWSAESINVMPDLLLQPAATVTYFNKSTLSTVIQNSVRNSMFLSFLSLSSLHIVYIYKCISESVLLTIK